MGRRKHLSAAAACVLLLAALAIGDRGMGCQQEAVAPAGAGPLLDGGTIVRGGSVAKGESILDGGSVTEAPLDASRLRGRVFDSVGAAVAARLQSAPVQALACPCGGIATRLDAPECRCEEAVQAWVRQLDACRAPASEGQPTEADGHFSLERPEDEQLLWAANADGGTVLRISPDLTSEVSLVLRPLAPVTVLLSTWGLLDVPGLTQIAAARAALIAPDGTCQPLKFQPPTPGRLSPPTFVSPPVADVPWVAVIDVPERKRACKRA